MTRIAWILAVMCLWGHTARASEDTLKLLAFNVLYEGADDAKSLDAIDAADPDVICLRELTPGFSKAFEKRLGARFPHRRLQPKSGTWGVGIASKRPLSHIETFPVPPLKLPAMSARVTLDGADVELTCVHLNPPLGKHRKDDDLPTTMRKNDAVRKKQAATLVTRLAKVTRPVVLFGDFNEGPGGEALKRLESAGFVRGCAVANRGCSGTFPGPAVFGPAIFEIDHVFARGLEFVSARTVREGGSDHFPVEAVVRRGR